MHACTRMYSQRQACTRTRSRAYTRVCARARTHACTPLHPPSLPSACTPAHMPRARAHAHAATHACPHTLLVPRWPAWHEDRHARFFFPSLVHAPAHTHVHASMHGWSHTVLQSSSRTLRLTAEDILGINIQRFTEYQRHRMRASCWCERTHACTHAHGRTDGCARARTRACTHAH